MLIRELFEKSRYAIERGLCRLFEADKGEKRLRQALDISLLEDRLMLSATPLPVEAIDVPTENDPSMSVVETPNTTTETTCDSASRTPDNESDLGVQSSNSQEQLRRELVFVDTAAEDYHHLVDDLLAGSQINRQFEVMLLDSNQDGIEQISRELLDYNGLDAIHIVSHGSDGAIKLGNTWLSLDNVGGYAGQLVGWRDALDADADLLFYGCDLASIEDGRTLLEAVQTLTGADVAASTDDTGAAILGGEWQLEFEIGDVASQVAFSTTAQAEWHGLLNVAVPGAQTTTQDTPLQFSSAGGNRVSIVDADAGANETPAVDYLSTPLAFEANAGQTDSRVDYLARGSGYAVFLTEGDAVLALDRGDAGHVVRLDLVGANATPLATGEQSFRAAATTCWVAMLTSGIPVWPTTAACAMRTSTTASTSATTVRISGNWNTTLLSRPGLPRDSFN